MSDWPTHAMSALQTLLNYHGINALPPHGIKAGRETKKDEPPAASYNPEYRIRELQPMMPTTGERYFYYPEVNVNGTWFCIRSSGNGHTYSLMEAGRCGYGDKRYAEQAIKVHQQHR